MKPEILGDRYRLDAVIAEGGAATVYKALDLRLDRPVAVKLSRPGVALPEPNRGAFLDEARTIARLNHPNIVAVHDAGVAGGRPYLVMELLPGPTLRERLAAGPLPVSEAIRIALGLANALEAAHSQRILHLDLKPENVLFGTDDEPKLADFGISRAWGQPAIGPDGLVLGTPAYLAPESITGEQLDGRADIYQLGVLFYEMLTGRRPFNGETPEERAAQRLVLDPVAPHLVNPAVPLRLGRIVLQALARDPATRYTSVAALVAELRGYQTQARQQTAAVAAEEITARARVDRPGDTRPTLAGSKPAWRKRRLMMPLGSFGLAGIEERRRAFWLLLPLLFAGILAGKLVLGTSSEADAQAATRSATPVRESATPAAALGANQAQAPTSSPAAARTPTATRAPTQTPVATSSPTPTPAPTLTPMAVPEAPQIAPAAVKGGPGPDGKGPPGHAKGKGKGKSNAGGKGKGKK